MYADGGAVEKGVENRPARACIPKYAVVNAK